MVKVIASEPATGSVDIADLIGQQFPITAVFDGGDVQVDASNTKFGGKIILEPSEFQLVS